MTTSIYTPISNSSLEYSMDTLKSELINFSQFIADTKRNGNDYFPKRYLTNCLMLCSGALKLAAEDPNNNTKMLCDAYNKAYKQYAYILHIAEHGMGDLHSFELPRSISSNDISQ